MYFQLNLLSEIYIVFRDFTLSQQIFLQQFVFYFWKQAYKEQKMNNTLKFSIKDHQFPDKNRKQIQRTSQINLLNLSQINGNRDKCNALNSDRTLSYRYQKINNSFRLVQVDGIHGENKENMNENNRRLSDGKTSKIIHSLNQLSERISRLQKNQQFEDQKQFFKIHKMIQKAVIQSSDFKNSKYCLGIQKNIQGVLLEVQQLKQKINHLSIVPAYLSENQVLKKCKNMIEEDIQREKVDRVKSMREQIQKLHQIVGRQSHSVNNPSSVEILRSIDLLNTQINQKIQNITKNIQVRLNQKKSQIMGQIKFLKQNGSKTIQQNNIKRTNQLSKKPNTQEKHHRTKCLKVIQIGFKTLNSKARERQIVCPEQIKKLQNITYQIDPQGFLVDSDGYYLQDEEGSTIRINEEHIKKLVQQGLFRK